MEPTTYIFAACCIVYFALAVLVAVRVRSQRFLVACCALTAVWAGAVSVIPGPSLTGPVGLLDFARALSWYIFLLTFFRKLDTSTSVQMRGFAIVAILGAMMGFADALPSQAEPEQVLTVLSLPILSRLLISVCELLLIENLYLNLPDRARWHVAIPSIVLGAFACIDILVVAEAILYHQQSNPLEGARAMTMIVFAPLLYAAAARSERWTKPVKLSRSAVFHSTTLVLSGSVMVCLAIAGELLREFTPVWGWAAELSLVFAGVVGIVLFLLSRSGRSLVYRRIVHHFFADEYDYRRQWMSCIDTLSGTHSIERTNLHTRAIRAIADAVDSPAGVLFLRDGPTGTMGWSGSWNMPATNALPAAHPLLALISDGETIADLSLHAEIGTDQTFAPLGRVWLAVPLLHVAGVIGAVIVAPPRVSFKPTEEVYGILRILGREVATYINEQRATEAMMQTRDLRDYGKRFAFVAHDIKNVASQLAMILQNAEHHISNPEFQQDMLATVGASVQKINGLLKRLEAPEVKAVPSSFAPASRLETLLATYRRARKANVSLEHDGSTGRVVMDADAFDMAVTHLLNNAVEASQGTLVSVKVHHEANRVVVAVVDRGQGMAPEFIRDHLFQPFETRKRDGSGIGAFQARELLREAGAELSVSSQPGAGTTMTMVFTRADQAIPHAVPDLVDAEANHG